MRRMYSNKELTEIIKQVIEEMGIGGDGYTLINLTDEQIAQAMDNYEPVDLGFVEFKGNPILVNCGESYGYFGFDLGNQQAIYNPNAGNVSLDVMSIKEEDGKMKAYLVFSNNM